MGRHEPKQFLSITIWSQRKGFIWWTSFKLAHAREEGKEEGKLAEREQLIRGMHKTGMPVEDIAKFTGLRVEDIQKFLESLT